MPEAIGKGTERICRARANINSQLGATTPDDSSRLINFAEINPFCRGPSFSVIKLKHPGVVISPAAGYSRFAQLKWMFDTVPTSDEQGLTRRLLPHGAGHRACSRMYW